MCTSQRESPCAERSSHFSLFQFVSPRLPAALLRRHASEQQCETSARGEGRASPSRGEQAGGVQEKLHDGEMDPQLALGRSALSTADNISELPARRLMRGLRLHELLPRKQRQGLPWRQQSSLQPARAAAATSTAAVVTFLAVGPLPGWDEETAAAFQAHVHAFVASNAEGMQ